jgi:hypothetical protein
VWAVCAAALGAGRVVPGVPRARREDGAGALLIAGVAVSVDNVESVARRWYTGLASHRFDSRAAHWWVHCHHTPCCSQAVHRGVVSHTHSTAGGHAPLSAGVALSHKPPSRSLKRAFSRCNVYETSRHSYDGVGADVTRSTPVVRAWVGGIGCRGELLVVRGKASTPVVVLMRGGCIRCAWPVDGARGAPAAARWS